MEKSNTIILFIDDLLKKNAPEVIALKRHFNTVELRRTPNKGLDYIHKNIENKLIIVLDYQFGTEEPNGLWVLEQIRKFSFIIPVILLTENNILQKEFPTFVNDKIFAIADKSNYKDVLKKVKEADIELSTKVEVALEDWINRHSSEDKDKPYLTMRSGKTFTLNEILKQIRLQTEFGQEMERKILNLAIELLANDVEKLS